MKNGVFAEGTTLTYREGQWFTDYWLEKAKSFLGILRVKVSRCKTFLLCPFHPLTVLLICRNTGNLP